MSAPSFHQVMEPHAKLRTRLVNTNAPGDRAKADKLVKLATSENVAILKEAVPQAPRDDFYGSNESLLNALAILIHAAADGDLEAGEVVVRAAERLRDERPTRVDHRGTYWQLFALFSDVPAAADAFEVLDAVYRDLPPTPAALWAHEIGLEVPNDQRWGFRIALASVETPTVDVDVHIFWSPDVEAEQHRARLCKDWFAAGAEAQLYSGEQPTGPLDYDLTVAENGATRTLAGTIDPAPADIRDLRRVLDAVEEQNGITFHRAKARVLGAGKVKAQKPVRDWLKGVATPAAAKPAKKPAAATVSAPKKSAAPAAAKPAAEALEGATVRERLADRKLAARLSNKGEPETRKEIGKLAPLVADTTAVRALMAALDGATIHDFGPMDGTGTWAVALLCQAIADGSEAADEAALALGAVATTLAPLAPDRHLWRAWQPMHLFRDEAGVADAVAPLDEVVAATESSAQMWADRLGLATTGIAWQLSMKAVGDELALVMGVDRFPGGADEFTWNLETPGGGGYTGLTTEGENTVEVEGDSGASFTGTLPPAPTSMDDVLAYFGTVEEVLGTRFDGELRLEPSKGIKPAKKVEKWFNAR